MTQVWRKCSVCKKDIPLKGIYQKCSVSTCRKNVYCSVNCWEVHVPVMGHKSAWAEEEIAPSIPFNETTDSEIRATRRIIIDKKESTSQSDKETYEGAQDILIVASKLKNYIKARYDMNTSAGVMERLSELVRELTDKAAMNARQEGRKTVMDRDY